MPKPMSNASGDPLIGDTYLVGDRRIALAQAGEGGPAVVFLPGAGLIGLDFLPLHEAASRVSVSVVYDRPGTGWSDGARLPRTAADVATELCALLERAGVKSPYILVGHSLGGAYIRRFAQLYPSKVAGLVFLDPAHEGYETLPRPSALARLRQTAAMLRAVLDIEGFYRPLFERMLAGFPEPARSRLIDYHLTYWRRSLDEARNLQPQVLNEIRAGGPLPDVPTIVITAMGIDPFMAPFMSAADLARINERKLSFYEAFAASLPRGENRALADAGHSTIHVDRPDAVLKAIADVLRAARADARRRAPAQAFA